MDTSSFTVGLLCPRVYRTLSPLGRGQGEGRCLSRGLGFYGLGVYLHALSRLHGWSAGLISVAVGQRSVGTVFGLVAATAQIGVALGPGLTGLLHDALGSYQPVRWCLVGLESLAVASVFWGKGLRETSFGQRR